MCAIVPVTPVVVTLPVTLLSSPIEIVPLPEPDEVTGGTSWPPLNMTLTSSAWAENGYQVRSTAAPRATTTRERLAVREGPIKLFGAKVVPRKPGPFTQHRLCHTLSSRVLRRLYRRSRAPRKNLE